MSNETLPQASQPVEGEQDGGENVSDSIKLEDLNSLLGKEFKDVESAKKSLKDTQSFVGKKIEQPAVDPTLESRMDTLQSQLNDSNFYRDNPQYNNKETIDLIAGLGGDPKDVVEKDVFKNVFEKTSAYDKSQESKSVLHNNSRLKQASNKMDDANTSMSKANDAAAQGNITEALREKDAAEQNAVASVVDSFGK